MNDDCVCKLVWGCFCCRLRLTMTFVWLLLFVVYFLLAPKRISRKINKYKEITLTCVNYAGIPFSADSINFISFHFMVCKQKPTHIQINWDFCVDAIRQLIHFCSCIYFYLFFLNHKKTIKNISLSHALAQTHLHALGESERLYIRTYTPSTKRRKEMLEATNEIETTDSIWMFVLLSVAYCRSLLLLLLLHCYTATVTATAAILLLVVIKQITHFRLCRKCTKKEFTHWWNSVDFLSFLSLSLSTFAIFCSLSLFLSLLLDWTLYEYIRIMISFSMFSWGKLRV